MFHFRNSSIKSKYYGSNKLVISKMRDETGAVIIKGFFGLKPKMYSVFVDDRVIVKS